MATWFCSVTAMAAVLGHSFEAKPESGEKRMRPDEESNLKTRPEVVMIPRGSVRLPKQERSSADEVRPMSPRGIVVGPPLGVLV
jgi:hypothetical protein